MKKDKPTINEMSDEETLMAAKLCFINDDFVGVLWYLALNKTERSVALQMAANKLLNSR